LIRGALNTTDEYEGEGSLHESNAAKKFIKSIGERGGIGPLTRKKSSKNAGKISPHDMTRNPPDQERNLTNKQESNFGRLWG